MLACDDRARLAEHRRCRLDARNPVGGVVLVAAVRVLVELLGEVKMLQVMLALEHWLKMANVAPSEVAFVVRCNDIGIEAQLRTALDARNIVGEMQQLRLRPDGDIELIFEGKPDGRQADTAIEVSRFRPRYRALTDEEKALHDEIKNKAEELEQIFKRVKDGRYHSLALTSLEQSIMWIVKELTS